VIPTVAFYLIFFLAFYLASDILSGDMVFGSRPALQHPELVIWCPALTPQCRKKTGVMAASERSREEGSKEGREGGRKEGIKESRRSCTFAKICRDPHLAGGEKLISKPSIQSPSDSNQVVQVGLLRVLRFRWIIQDLVRSL
jgi:hypothetical protein